MRPNLRAAFPVAQLAMTTCGGAALPAGRETEIAMSMRAMDDVVERVSIPISPTRPGSAHVAAQPLEIDSPAFELARLLIAPDPADALTLLDDLAEHTRTSKQLFENVIEPAARSLGDLWNEDECVEFDVAIGLCHLQSAMRRINDRMTPASMPGFDARSVLVVPQPGERHMLCAALDSEILWQAGWNAHCAFPPTDQALQDLLAKEWFDALDLSLSASFRREHWLSRIAKTIAGAREASRNPALAVVIGGRLFSEQPDFSNAVGADACVYSSVYAAETMSRAVGRRGQMRCKV